MKKATEQEFNDFIENYPNPLTVDICGIPDPPMAHFYDKTLGIGFQAIVAQYDCREPNEHYGWDYKREYWVKG